MAEGKELGWEDEITKEGEEFKPIPAGDYDFTIDHFDRGRSSGTGKLPPCNMATVYFTIHADDRDVTIRENYILHTSMEWKLSQLFRSVGLKKKDEPLRMNWTALPGLKGRAKVKLEPGYNNPDQMYNRIDKLYPADEVKRYEAGKF